METAGGEKRSRTDSRSARNTWFFPAAIDRIIQCYGHVMGILPVGIRIEADEAVRYGGRGKFGLANKQGVSRIVGPGPILGSRYLFLRWSIRCSEIYMLLEKSSSKKNTLGMEHRHALATAKCQ